MRAKVGITLSAVALLIIAGCAPANYPGRNWDFIGERVVSNRAERDVIRVRGRDAYRAIKFEVLNEEVRVRDIEVEFENGRRQRINMHRKFRPGWQSRAIDLQGGKRRVDRIVFRYRADSYGRRPAVIRVYGLR